jgi:hypothetical protein
VGHCAVHCNLSAQICSFTSWWRACLLDPAVAREVTPPWSDIDIRLPTCYSKLFEKQQHCAGCILASALVAPSHTGAMGVTLDLTPSGLVAFANERQLGPGGDWAAFSHHHKQVCTAPDWQRMRAIFEGTRNGQICRGADVCGDIGLRMLHQCRQAYQCSMDTKIILILIMAHGCVVGVVWKGIKVRIVPEIGCRALAELHFQCCSLTCLCLTMPHLPLPHLLLPHNAWLSRRLRMQSC